MEKPGFEPATPGLQDIGLSPTLQPLFSMGLGGWISIAQSTSKCTVDVVYQMISIVNFLKLGGSSTLLK